MKDKYKRMKAAQDTLKTAWIELAAKVAESNVSELVESMTGAQRLRLHKTTMEKLELWVKERTEFEEEVHELLNEHPDEPDA